MGQNSAPASQPLRLGIVGCGRVVEEAHAPALTSLPEHALVAAIADPSAERRAAVAAALPGSTSIGEYSDWTELLSTAEIDAVVVALPHDLHEHAILDAAAAGVDIISEKPLATSLDAVDRIATAVESAGVRLSVMHNWQFNPEAVAALGAIENGRIGTPFLVRNEAIWGAAWKSKDPSGDWRLSRERSGGGAVIDMAYHALYVSEREQRAPIVRVAAALGSFGNDSGVDDTGAVVLVHANGGISVVQRCWLAQGGGAGAHEVHGTRGSIRFAQLDTRVMSHIFQGDYGAAAAASRDVDAGPPVEIFENEVGEWAPLELSPGPLNWWDGIREVFRQTLERWSIGESAPVGIASARHTLAAVEACYLSAERGTSVELAELERDVAHNHRSPR